jgi:hypothetical protein
MIDQYDKLCQWSKFSVTPEIYDDSNHVIELKISKLAKSISSTLHI